MEAFNREALKLAIEGSVVRLYQAQTQTVDPFRNTLDCFSASIDALTQNITMDDWFKQELERQKQKTKQNAIGTLHEEILGSIGGVENLPVGNLIDIKCDQKQIIAEVKNKHNTTKGNHKVQIYRDLANKLEELPGYIGYYVEILPKSQSRYDKPFTPSDNQTHAQLEARDDIRVIDGRSFYALLTGFDNALDELYEELPSIISEIISEQFGVTLEPHKVTGSGLFSEFYAKAYGDIG